MNIYCLLKINTFVGNIRRHEGVLYESVQQQTSFDSISSTHNSRKFRRYRHYCSRFDVKQLLITKHSKRIGFFLIESIYL